MSSITLLFIALAMSSDAFAASLGKGASLQSPKLINAIKMGLIFGTIETITPLIGWGIGRAGSVYMEAWDHWIAFVLLVGLGLYMVRVSVKGEDADDEQSTGATARPLLTTIITAIGTSIDALTVGVSLAFLDVSIVAAALMIGAATTVMVTIGALLGRAIGHIIGNKAELLGGVTLIVIGCWILYSHLSAG